MTQNSIQFLMNDQLTQIVDLDPNMTVLHYLREHQLKPGTKEGCGSGDCGACTVVTVELSGKNNESLAYKSINACITFVGNLHGKQLVTIEHLKQLKDNTKSQLHPVQKHMVENHASQCGFCTPGIVMSCFALHKKNQNPDRTEVMTALAGNLCRCTGYRSIIDAAMQSTDAFEADISSDKTKQIIRQLQTIQTQSFLQFRFAGKTYVSPKNTRELSAYLLANPSSTLVSGGTDLALMVTQDLAEFTQLVSLENVCELNNISKNSETI
ncbi:MAG: 2Fe-2S iron-sulfur cluster-binding protein, partial [Kangiellaceae bacterium]|nr:2Fe-2S iron-sulfur cluster-binding protein [Kangiellaceae bacterium]